jgi:hypothetical protein
MDVCHHHHCLEAESEVLLSPMCLISQTMHTPPTTKSTTVRKQHSRDFKMHISVFLKKKAHFGMITRPLNYAGRPAYAQYANHVPQHNIENEK